MRLDVKNEPEVLLEPGQPVLPLEAEQLFALVEDHRTVVAPLKLTLVLSAVMSTVGWDGGFTTVPQSPVVKEIDPLV